MITRCLEWVAVNKSLVRGCRVLIGMLEGFWKQTVEVVAPL